MSGDEIKRIKDLIQKAETKGAKAQGVMERIEEKWKKEFGDAKEGQSMLKVAEKAYDELIAKIQKQEERKSRLEKELESMYDWDALEEALS